MNKWIAENWKAIAMVSTLLISGVGGYTNLLLEFGELRAEVHFLRDALGDCIQDLE